MNDSTSDKAAVRDYRDTLFLPKTDFPMRAGLPQREPEILKRWQDMDLYRRTQEAAGGGTRFILHDGPPYANGNIHLGTALNKILKDVVSRSQWMMGKDANYVPGWDCHGLPIEWKVEETYRAKGLDKDEVPINEFRRECREFAARWIDVQREEFQRLGVLGDWKDPYTTMKFESEARIARELMKFAMSGQLYRGSKPVMWSVVEHTALAEAEVEYHDYTSDTVWVTFPVAASGTSAKVPAASKISEDQDTGETTFDDAALHSWAKEHGAALGEVDELVRLAASVVIWTTTPWTIPGNRAISFSPRIGYGLYRVDEAPADNWAKSGDLYVIADALAEDVMKAARVETYSRVRDVSADVLSRTLCRHPLHGNGYDFAVPLLEGDHVTDEAGTGFVHTAPGHGREDFDVWMENAQGLEAAGIDTAIPFTVDAAGAFTADAPGFEGKRVINDKGEKGEANDAVIRALVAAGNLIARGRLKHQYPHSWRSKKPVIFRNTPQWFITMGDGKPDGLRARALKAIDEVQWVPPAGRNRMRGMIETRPDWVISRQRAWGVPITVFRNTETGEVIPGADFAGSDKLMDRIAEAFTSEGADAWFADGARERFLDGLVDDPAAWEKVSDILDVWFESGSTHAFVLEVRDDLKVQRQHEGGSDRIMYLEGSDQHRGWFHSSLLESCGTRGRAPYDVVLTHGFVVDEDGRKMSKSLGNVVEPQDVIRQSGAEILRLWAASSDYAEDLRLGPEILKSNVDAYRKLRNTLRYLLGALAGYSKDEAIAAADMPELERYMLHRLHETGVAVRKGYESFDFKRAYWALLNFMTIDLSAFYFDIRKDALYCDPLSSVRRRACRTLMDKLFHCLTTWLAPVMCFTMEEAWQSRFGEGSVHLQRFPEVEANWRDTALGAKWDKVREVRRVVTGALEIERQVKKTIGASLEAAPVVYVSDPDLLAALDGVDLAEISITSDARLVAGEGPADAFRLDEVAGVAVVPEHAQGRKCARSWKISEEVGADPEFPDITPRDAEAVREWQEAEGRA